MSTYNVRTVSRLVVFLLFGMLGVILVQYALKSTHNPALFDTTVVYVYSGNDALYGQNLAYFLNHGIKKDDGNMYYIVLQQGTNWANHERSCVCTINCPMSGNHCGCLCPNEASKISLPKNVKLVYHENLCFDMGTVGELADKGLIDISSSTTKHVLIINSSVRGPFVPSYMDKQYRWTDAFTSKINGLVKLVGPSISCGSPQPHVQSFLIATDQVGLGILRKEGAFKCYATQAETVQHSEIGGSAAILRWGYSIDSLMLKYQGVDWRDAKNHKCNQQINPGPQYMYDGTTVNPLETMFVKVKTLHADARWANVQQAIKYSQWSAPEHDPSSNEFMALKQALLPGLRASIRKECFDFESYKNANYDLKALNWTEDQLLEHYLTDGYYEARPGVHMKC